MEGYFGNNGDYKYTVPPLNLSIDNISPFGSPRSYDLASRARHYDESAMRRFLLSSSSSSDEHSTPRHRSSSIGSDQLHRLSSGSSGGCLSLRGSPLSSLENVENSPRRRSELASSAVKIEEDVLVMDAIPVRRVARSSASGRSGKMKSPLSLSSDSGLLTPSSPVSGYGKREICRSWEDFGVCKYGPKCVFAHGKEEIDPRFITNTTSMIAHICEEIDPNIISKAKSEANMGKSSKPGKSATNPKPDGGKVGNEEHKNKESGSSSSSSLISRDWHPMDDGITGSLPYPAKNPPSREAVEEYMNKKLSAQLQSRRKRLPVFEGIYPSGSKSSP